MERGVHAATGMGLCSPSQAIFRGSSQLQGNLLIHGGLNVDASMYVDHSIHVPRRREGLRRARYLLAPATGCGFCEKMWTSSLSVGVGTGRGSFRFNCISRPQGVDEGGGESEQYEMPASVSSPGAYIVETGSAGSCAVTECPELDRVPTKCGILESELSLYTGRVMALERFGDEVSKPDEEINLLHGAVFIAQHLYPKLSVEEVDSEFDRMVSEIQSELPPPEERYPMRMIKAINNYLYGRAGWKGAPAFLDPDNFCINSVLDRRQGLPITMSLVYMELAKRIGLPMQGVNLPGHFMCRPGDEDLEFLVDSYSEGKINFLQDAEEKLSSIFGGLITLKRNLKRARVSNRSFLTRMLYNLKKIYIERKELVSTLCIINFRKLVRPGEIDEIRDYGICLYLLERYPEAVPCLEQYLATAPMAQDCESVRRLLLKMRREI